MRAVFRRGRLRVALGVSSLLARVAHAETSAPFEVHWDAPRGCPDPVYVSAAVSRLLEGWPHEGSSVRADATVTKREDGVWTLALTTTRDGSVGHRSLQADSCCAVADATALIVALTIDPVHVKEPGAPVPVPIAPPTPVSTSTPTTIPTPTPTTIPTPTATPTATTRAATTPPRLTTTPRTSSGSVHVALAASFAGDVGSLPEPAYGVQGSAALLLPRVRLEAYGGYWPDQTGHANATTGFGALAAQVHLIDAGGLGCFVVLSSRRWELDPCAGVELGSISGVVQSPVPSTQTSGLWSAARFDARVTLRFTDRLGLAASLGVAVPFRRQEFVVQEAPGSPAAVSIFRSSALAGRVFIGPELRF